MNNIVADSSHKLVVCGDFLVTGTRPVVPEINYAFPYIFDGSTNTITSYEGAVGDVIYLNIWGQVLTYMPDSATGVPAIIRHIADSAFTGVASQILISNITTLVSIGDNAFKNSSLVKGVGLITAVDIVMDETQTNRSIGVDAFRNCNLQGVSLTNVDIIGSGAFYDNPLLEQVELINIDTAGGIMWSDVFDDVDLTNLVSMQTDVNGFYQKWMGAWQFYSSSADHSYTIDPMMFNFDFNSNMDTINMTLGNDVSYTVKSYEPWVQVNDMGGFIEISVDENDTGMSREAMIEITLSDVNTSNQIAMETVTVYQDSN